MRLETIPIILGALVALLGVGLVADALVADGTFVPTERRRRPRAPRHPVGEMLVGAGIVALGAALIGSDRWRWGTVAVLAGLVLITAGALLNRRFLAELFTNRGALRRSEGGIDTATTARTERVVRRRAVPDGARGEAADSPPALAPKHERRADPRGGDGPRRIR